MPGTALLSKLLLPATSFEELTPPRPPTKVRVLSPELRDALQAKALAMERAKRSGKPIDEAMLEEAEDLENGGAGLGQHGPGGRRGPFGPHGPAGRRYGRGHYGGYAGSDYDDYDRYGPEGYDPNAYGSQAPNGRRRRPRRYIPYKGDGKGGGSQWIAGDGAREGGSSDAGNGGLSVPAGKRPPWELAPPDVVPWHGDTEHGPCDADDVFSVREVVRKIAPLLIGSGCEKYVMDADKMLNDLPTDRDTTRMPACKNNFIVKSTAKTVYSVEKCAIKALAKAEHVNATEENKIKELVKELCLLLHYSLVSMRA